MSEEQQLSNKIDDYLLISVIGTGKTCQVYEAMHEQSGATVAMKLMLPEAMALSAEKALLKHEGRVAQLFEHPNLIRCNGIVMRKTECYLLLDLFKTPNLKMMAHANRAAVLCRLKKMIEGVCAGLGHMHDKGWIHKDLKPDNILMNLSAEVRLIDFSLAVKKATGLSKIFAGKKGKIRGTRTYLAPETIRREPSSPPTDIYSLGVTLYEIVTGKSPFTGESPQDLLKRHLAEAAQEPSLLNDNITPEMDAFILKMLAKKAKDRFQDCSEIVSTLSRLQMFKEEPVEEALAEEKRRASADEVERLEELMENRLDSRTDAQVQTMLQENPALMKSFNEIKQRQADREAARKAEVERRSNIIKGEKSLKERQQEEKEEKKKARQQKRAAAQQPMPQPAPQQPMPGYYPQAVPPPGYVPAMPPQPYAMPPQPGYPPTPQAGMPAQPPPPGYGQVPGQPVPPGAAQPPPPGAVPPGPPQTAASSPPKPKPPQVKPKAPRPQPPPPAEPDDEMDFMTELPDFE